ncbi:L-cystine transporter [Priestia taiwanensis]|uniref:L-cystine uptake protein TcyP n=1 Tax=Priestia taiwanensis TaxID=1347902 RepID=A0A917ATR4_9BACI|nr:L-cystine transporter [Priestia taiwanensis]MBM7363714.1 L-cystine uptake protein TcyP (sodium:dicarboxylate symporter family) [Priestia taiwanensis]GGE74732.1 L-cystine uptake protein TcyP [Priestia taiwanensis]
MNLFLIIVNIVAMLVLMGILYYMQKKHVSFSKRVFTALGLGVLFGAILQFFHAPSSDIIKTSNDWFSLIGSGYVKLLQMVVMPLILVSIISAFTKLKFSNNLGKISGLIIGILIATTAISAGIAIATSIGFDLKAVDIQAGEVETARGEALETRLKDVESKTLPQQVLEVIPTNPFLDLTGQRPTSTIAVVIFAAFIGVALLGIKRKNPEQAEFFIKMVDAFYAIVMRIVTLVLRLTPYGVLALMTKMVSSSNIDSILKLGNFVLASYVALIAVFIVHLLIIALVGLNPITFVKKALPTLTFAFTSRTSAGSIPLNIDAQTKRLGVSEGIANFSASFGASIGQNGCAGVYPAMLAVMIAPTVGIDPLSVEFIFTLIAVVAVSSFGVAGVGGGATFAALIVLSTMNLPVALAGLLITVEPLIDMGRTAVNVSGSMTAGVVSSKVLGELDTETYNDKNTEAVSI